MGLRLYVFVSVYVCVYVYVCICVCLLCVGYMFYVLKLIFSEIAGGRKGDRARLCSAFCGILGAGKRLVTAT